MKKYLLGVVVTNAPMIKDVYSMVLAVPRLFDSEKKAPGSHEVKPGRFVGLFTGDASKLLPRPLGICEVIPESGMIRLVYRVAGNGTEVFAAWEPGTRVNLLGPLGNGFTPITDADNHIVVGGGMGVVPLLGLAKSMECTAVLGYADEVFLADDFRRHCGKVHVATESGKSGTKGNVLDVLKEMNLSGAGTAMYACGPKLMLKALSDFARERNIPLQVSIEERMACGMGACLCCAVDAGGTYKRVCKDGPVFDSREVSL